VNATSAVAPRRRAQGVWNMFDLGDERDVRSSDEMKRAPGAINQRGVTSRVLRS
jgi:hypothetical protein